MGLKVSGEIKSKAACRSSWFFILLKQPSAKKVRGQNCLQREGTGAEFYRACWISGCVWAVRAAQSRHCPWDSSATSRETLRVCRGVVGRRCLGADQARTASCSRGHGQDLSSNSRFTTLLSSSVWLFGTWASGCMGRRQTGPRDLPLPLGSASSIQTIQDRLLVEKITLVFMAALLKMSFTCNQEASLIFIWEQLKHC